MVSELNGNLVVRFTDYKTDEPFLSFLGSNKPSETALSLLEYCAANGLPSHLKLMPEISVKGIDPQRFQIEEDRDNFDYITSVYRLHTYSGAELSAKRRQHALFSRRNKNFIFRQLDLSDQKTMEDVRNLFSIWLVNKNEHLPAEQEHEFIALQRCLSVQSPSLIATGIFIEESLTAFWILEDIGNGYTISHFEKADLNQHIGISPYLKQKTAEILHKRELVYVNLEQDLGIPGLRKNKESYYPQHFLKKFAVIPIDRL